MKTPWSLRDNPVSLALLVIGVLVVMLTLGWLTARMGMLWTRSYVHRQTQTSE